MFKFLFISTAVITMISMHVVGDYGSKKTAGGMATPLMIGSNGEVSFPGKSPRPATIFKIRRAIQTEDTETLSALLVEHHLYIAPSDFSSAR